MRTKLLVVVLTVALSSELVFAGWAVNRYIDHTNHRIAALEQSQCSCVMLLIPGATPSDEEETAR